MHNWLILGLNMLTAVAAGISAFYWWRSAMVPYPPELKGMVTWNGMASVPTRDLGEAVRKTGHLNKIAAAFAGIVALATVAR